ncbi:MAG: 3-phosphoshikimate 1-carboxyvinyltransferase, partial [Nitrosopumilus sp.]
MKCKIDKSNISGEIICPQNKSYTHRAIFMASLAGNNSKVDNVLLSSDTIATIEACKKFGAELDVQKSSVIVKNSIKLDTKVTQIDAENSGTTIRIAAGIASLFSHEIILTGDSSLQKRPMKPLLDALSTIGAKYDSKEGKPPIKITGKILGGNITIPGNLSSQFISALLIIAPITKKGININIEGNLVSKPYLDATIATMREFGITVQTLIPYKKYNIHPQVYKQKIFTVPIDFSSLALLLSASVLIGKEVTIKGSIGNLPQGDEAFIDILEQLGVTVFINDKEIKVKSPEKLTGGRFDLS